MNIIRKVLVGIVSELPMSLMIKLSDGRLTTQEIVELSREVAMVVFKVLHAEYGDKDGDGDIDMEDMKQILFG